MICKSHPLITLTDNDRFMAMKEIALELVLKENILCTSHADATPNFKKLIRFFSL